MTSGLTHATDTVERAAATPDQPQPFRELGLKEDEYQRIRDILGRRPTDAELAMYSVMWSEHCSYKSSKVHLRYFGETTTDEMRAGMLAGIGENAGVVDIGSAEIQVHPVLTGCGVVHLLEAEPRPVRADYRDEFSGNQFLCLAIELLRPPRRQLHGVAAVESDHLHVECHTRDLITDGDDL